MTVVSAVFENFPRTNTRKYVVVIAVCLVGFLLGLPCVTEVIVFISLNRAENVHVDITLAPIR